MADKIGDYEVIAPEDIERICKIWARLLNTIKDDEDLNRESPDQAIIVLIALASQKAADLGVPVNAAQVALLNGYDLGHVAEKLLQVLAMVEMPTPEGKVH